MTRPLPSASGVVAALLLLGACTGATSGDGVRAGSGGSAAGSGGTAAFGGSGGASAGGSSGTVSGGSGGASVGGSGGASVGGSSGAAGAAGAPALGGGAGEAAVGGMGGAAGQSGTAGTGGGLDAFELVVIGSSTAAGEGASQSSRGWVRLLSDALRARVATSFSSRNLAVGGYATADLLPDSGASGNIDDALELAPNLVVVALAGSNDLSAGVSGSTFLARLTTIRDAAVAAGVPVFFVGTAPKDLGRDEREALAAWSDSMAERFETCWVPAAEQYTPCFIDVFDALASDSLGIDSAFGAGDGIHLNDAGHAEIARIAEDVIEPYVCSVTRCR